MADRTTRMREARAESMAMSTLRLRHKLFQVLLLGPESFLELARTL